MTQSSPASAFHEHAVRWLFLALLALTVLGGALLSLPICWAGPYPVQPDHPLTRYQLAGHTLNCLFTAGAAVTGTSLSVFDIGHDLSRAGQMLLIALMEIGGLGVLLIGSVVGWRLRRVLGWGVVGEDGADGRVRRPLVFVCAVALVIQAAGAGLLLISSDIVPVGRDIHAQDRLLAAVFHAVSAFCNCGLTLSRDSLLGQRDTVAPYAILMPLMLLGGIGGPVLYELCGRLRPASDKVSRRGLSADGRITLLATLGLIVAGAGLLFAIESTTRWQLRYPRENTPGRIAPPGAPASGEIIFSAEGSSRAQNERLRTMTSGRRLVAALFQGVSARTCGMSTARLDESSLSPASRLVLMGGMLIGGAVGGTAGGLRILVVVLLFMGLVQGQPDNMPNTTRPHRTRAVLAASGVALSMFMLIGATTFVLVYRQAASLEAGLFEAVSATCNVGFSTGLTRQLVPLAVGDRLAGQLALLLAMLLGRVLPLGVLLRCAPSRLSDNYSLELSSEN